MLIVCEFHCQHKSGAGGKVHKSEVGQKETIGIVIEWGSSLENEKFMHIVLHST